MNRQEIKKILKNIENGKELELNLPNFARYLFDKYNKYSMIKLALNYYTFYEVYHEAEDLTNISDTINEINNIIKSYNSEFNGETYKSDLIKLDSLRKEIIDRMNVLTVYTDSLEIYEHVLNRIENRFEANIEEEDIEEFAAEVVRFIFELKDNMAINDKIKQVIKQLPVRITKNKFYDMLRDSLSLYNKGELSTLKDYVKMIEWGAMLQRPNGYGTYFEDIYSTVKELTQTNYSTISKEEYEVLANKVTDSAEVIINQVDIYLQLVEIINDLYVIMLARPYVMDQDEELNVALDIITTINNNFYNYDENIMEEVINKMSILEGKQEFVYDNFAPVESTLELALEEHKTVINDIMLSPQYNSLCLIKNLVSTSLFVDLDNVDSVDNSIVDENTLRNITEELINKIDISFKEQPMIVNRAVMAFTFEKLPVFFNDTDEIYNYIVNALDQCRDISEKSASINLIYQLIEEYSL